MPNPTAHLSELTLEQLAEGELPANEHQQALRHTENCARCAAEMELYRSLFGALAALPRFAPSPEFSETVVARLRVGPRVNPVLAWLHRWLPKTARGWSALAVTLATPVVGVIALVAWLLSQPLISPAYLWQWATMQAVTLAKSTSTTVLGFGNSPVLAGVAESAYGLLLGVPTGILILVVVVLAVGIPLSAWSLIRLVRTPMGKVTYAN